MEQEPDTLRVFIDGQWTPDSFSRFFQTIASMYYKTLLTSAAREEWFSLAPRLSGLIVGDIRSTREIDKRNAAIASEMTEWFEHRGIVEQTGRDSGLLLVGRIQFGSPGSIDFFGIGAAFQAMFDAVSRMIRFFEDRTLRHEAVNQSRLNTKLLKLQVERAELELQNLPRQLIAADLASDFNLQREAAEISQIHLENAAKLMRLRAETLSSDPNEIEENTRNLLTMMVRDQERIHRLLLMQKVTAIDTSSHPPK